MRPAGRLFHAYLLLTAGVTGALVMVIEVMGSRVLGPVFGVSLFVWTALIAVTLLALACGYALGGHLADRRRDPDLLYWVLLAAGFATLAVPALKASVITACVPLGLRLGALAAALLLFGPSLVLLGCVAPYVVRLAADDMDRLGRTVGLFYALSTLGSLLGTVLTGFVLIAHLGIRGVFQLVGAVLVAMAAVYFAAFRRRWPVAAALLALPFWPAGPGPFASKVMANGTTVTEVFRQEGFYGTVQVVEYSYGALRTREMLIDGLVQGGLEPASGLPVYEHTYFMQFLPYVLHPRGRTCLAVGLGPGLVPAWFAGKGIRTDVVEINPDVVDTARRHFGFVPSGRVHVADARRFLEEPGERYDYVLVDVFTGDTTPGHLLTVEALRAARRRLAPDGVLALNVAGSLGEHPLMTASVVRTLREVFETVRVHPTFPAAGTGRWGNLTLVAHAGPPRVPEWDLVAGAPVHLLARDSVACCLRGEYRFPADAPALLLTDDFNPLDARDAWLKGRVRRELLEATDWDVLL